MIRPNPRTSVADVDVHTARRLADEGAMLLDVRELGEWTAGHIPGAVHLPLGAVADADTASFAGRPVVAVCRSGNRSGKAASELSARGVDVVNLAGGMQAWAAAGLPVRTDAGSPGSVA